MVVPTFVRLVQQGRCSESGEMLQMLLVRRVLLVTGANTGSGSVSGPRGVILCVRKLKSAE